MSFLQQSQFVNVLTTDERLNGSEFLKRKRNFEDDILKDDIDYNTYNTKKHIKNDILLSDYNIKPYYNPLLIIDMEKSKSIEHKIDHLYKLNNLQIDNSKKINSNVKTLYRYSILQFNDLNTKIDILNSKFNIIDKDIIDMTHKLCLKIDKLEKEIKTIKSNQ
jgi:hypothetical protein